MSAKKRDGLRLAFVGGLTEKKLLQKLVPLTLSPEIAQVDVYRRAPFARLDKTRHVALSPLGRRATPAGELEKCARLLAAGGRYDAVIGCFQIPHGIWAHLAAALWRTPVIQLVITDVAWNLNRPLARWPMLNAHACGVRGEGALRTLRDLSFSGPLEVIHNPMEISGRADKDGEKTNDILAVGDFAEEKDYPWMLDVLSALAARGVDFKATLCGSFPDRFRRAVVTAGLENAIRFPGHLHGLDLERVYASSRVLLMTSHTEGLPMAAVEAMAAGMAVAVTTAGELPWLVRDGRDGRVSPHGDTPAMTDALATMLATPNLARDMGNSGRRRIESLAPFFTPEAVAQAWRRLLTELNLL